MPHYVKIDRLNGRFDYWALANRLYDDNITEVEYFEGRWSDTALMREAPHLRFEEESDALAYVLKYGGLLYNTIPLCSKD